MLPESREARQAIFLRWANGNVHAASFLEQMAEIARLADDIVDQDTHRQRNVCWLLSRVLTTLPSNAFFIAHHAALSPVLTTIIVQWEQSDTFRSSDDTLKHQFGFVIREAIDSLAITVAAITGGIEHARATATDIFDTCHGGSTETVEQWVRG